MKRQARNRIKHKNSRQARLNGKLLFKDVACFYKLGLTFPNMNYQGSTNPPTPL